MVYAGEYSCTTKYKAPKKFYKIYGTSQKKYGTLKKNFQSSVFCPEKFRKFYRTLFCNRL